MKGSWRLHRKKIRTIALIAAACLAALGIVWIAWSEGAFLPKWIMWQGPELKTSGSPPAEAELESRRVFVSFDGQPVWQSPAEYKVQDMILGDIDHDGKDDLLLLCWKIGRYGEHKPFYVKEDENAWSQHIFIYSLEEGSVQPKWMTSYLPFDVYRWEFNEKERLILTDLSGGTTRWDWKSWGLEIIDES